jgi:hypothetical protein
MLPTRRRHSLFALGALMPLLSPAAAPAQATVAAEAVRFAPHRAVYDITLERAATGSGVVELTGRMVYELQGSRCEGYTQNMRFVTRMIQQDGSEQLNDLRTSTWEDVLARRLRFNSTQLRDLKLVEETTGDARDDAAGQEIAVELKSPEQRALKLKGSVYFPMRHSEALVVAAREGRRQLVADLYDGSEKGEKVYVTSAVIGKGASGGEAGLPPKLAGRESLAHIASWPVSIGYFEPGAQGRDVVPSYELSFRIYENGVSSRLVIDYGEFSVRGELTELTYYPATDCRDGAAPPPAK